jgi:hypothetical protein
MPTTPQLEAIARSLKAHGTGTANVARLARLFHVTEESLAGAVKLANAPSPKAVTETAPTTTDPVLLERARRFQGEVITAEAKPIESASIADIEAMLAAAVR